MDREAPSQDISELGAGLTGELIYQNIISLVQHLRDPDIVFIPHELMHHSLSFEPNTPQSLWRKSQQVLLVEQRKQKPSKVYFRIRLQAKSADRLLPFELPFLKHLVEKDLLDKQEASKFQVAFDEGLANAIDHGCLELDSKLRATLLLDGRSEYDKLRAERLVDPHYSQRLIWLSFSLRGGSFICRIRDSGDGFDSQAQQDPIIELSKQSDLEKPSGRGLMLMRRFTDSTKYNRRSNQVTLVKILKR